MSSGSDSDEEFVPGEPEQLSEEDSADDDTDLQYEQELEHKAKKRKIGQEEKGKKNRKTKKTTKSIEVQEKSHEENKTDEKLDPEEEKKREEDLWAKFLEGTDTKAKPQSSVIVPVETEKQQNKKEKPEVTSTVLQKKEDEKAREKRIFEFAGETIVVENDVIKEKIIKDSPAPATKEGPSRSRVGGLSSVLGQLNKKSNLSTLEKSKLDWNTFKKTEGIEEEIQSHNKGKAGYLERQDFLERADVRQYEIERDLRMSRRSNR